MVTLVHTALFGLLPKESVFYYLFIGQGARGVQLFYVVSAFTLFLSLHQRERLENSPNLDFFIRRFFRIAPLYWVSIFYYLWQNGTGPNYWTGGNEPITTLNILSNFTFIHGINPYWINSLVPGGWSIAVEMSFYLTVPFLFAAYSNQENKKIFLYLLFFGTIAFSFLLRLILINHPLVEQTQLWNEYLFLFLPSQFPVFVIGMIAFHTVISTEDVQPKILLIYTAIMFIISLWLKKITGIHIIEPHIIVSVIFGIIVVALQRKPVKLLVNRPLIYIGKMSYSMYLMHFAAVFIIIRTNIIQLTKQTNSQPLVQFCIAYLALLTITLIISLFTNKLIEKPGIRLGELLTYKIERNRTNNRL